MKNKLKELTEEELKQVTGGNTDSITCENRVNGNCKLDCSEQTMKKCLDCWFPSSIPQIVPIGRLHLGIFYP